MAARTMGEAKTAPQIEADFQSTDGVEESELAGDVDASFEEDDATDTEEEAPSETADKAARAKFDSSDNFLARYFKEMARLSVLKPEEEFEAAQLIESLETDLWAHLLGHAQLIEVLVSVIAANTETPPEKALASLRRSAATVGSRAGVVARRRHVDLAAGVASTVLAADVDRAALFAVLTELRRIARCDVDLDPRHQGVVNIRTKAFQNYHRGVRERFAATQRARNAFVKANLRLVVSIARRFNHGRMPLSDLIQEGNIGLIKAVERYDYRRGFRFSTYASWWIRHSISRALADKGRAVRLPVHMIDAYHKVSKTRREMTNRLGRHPSADEIAQESGIAADKVVKLEGFLMDQAVSLDREVSGDDGRRFVDFIEDTDAALPSDRVMAESLNEQVMEALGELKPIESDILRKRFGLDGNREQTLKEIGEDYNLSRERIRQLQEQALGKIRRVLHRQEAI